MKELRADLIAVLAVLLLLLGFAAAFPRGSIDFAGADAGAQAQGAQASIVFLDPSAVAAAMRATKILPRNEDTGRTCADLLTVDLPDADMKPMLAIESRRRLPVPAVVKSGIPPFRPSLRAAAPVRIPTEKDRDDLPFPRAELLRLN